MLAHELCGHFVPNIGHPPEGDPTRYTVTDPVQIFENAIRAEQGWGTRTGEK